MSTAVAAEVPICFLDTETDSVRPDRQIWEVGAIRRWPDGSEQDYQAYLPIDLSIADPFALNVGRFWDRHPVGRRLAHGPLVGDVFGDPHLDAVPELASPQGVARDIARLTFGAHVIGAVPSFDTETIARLLRKHELLPGWHYHLGDVENLAVGFLAGRGQPMPPPWKSSDLTEALGVEPGTADEKHTALGDVRWAMRMYDAVMAGGPA